MLKIFDSVLTLKQQIKMSMHILRQLCYLFKKIHNCCLGYKVVMYGKSANNAQEICLNFFLIHTKMISK